MTKDRFSERAETYAQYRPGYPKELVEYVISFVNNKNLAWDCGTGNGQAASLLAEYFVKVFATDISEKQIANAKHLPNIFYSISPAENTSFPDQCFDLITVGQAYHWFKFDAFEKEAKRVGKPGGVVAVWGYNLMKTGDQSIDELVRNFYSKVVGPFWDAERKHVENLYQDIPFNFELLPSKDFEMKLEWKREGLVGYIQSWSAVQNFIKANSSDPVPEIQKEIFSIWPEDQIKTVSFPIFLKIGRIQLG
ncbi:MAG: SAM-dependent methyltransferase [Bacteroidetes bacterium]|nr:MAG: SAM-dependent methyltransferase [Bacteroidota bacterium]